MVAIVEFYGNLTKRKVNLFGNFLIISLLVFRIKPIISIPAEKFKHKIIAGATLNCISYLFSGKTVKWIKLLEFGLIEIGSSPEQTKLQQILKYANFLNQTWTRGQY